MKLHPTALISKTAIVGSNVEIGPYSVIGPQVKIGAGTRVMSHVVIDGHTTVGERCVIFPGACLGMPPQDKKFKGEVSFLQIGNDNTIREYATIHRGSAPGAKTVIGDKNFIMINCHIGHDCRLGDEITMVNGSVLGGHAAVEDGAVMGGYSGVHQYTRVGKLSMLGAFAKATMDVPPFSLCDGYPAQVCGINLVGLRRAGYSSSDLILLKKAIKTLFMSPFTLAHAAQKVKKELRPTREIQHLLEFVSASKRGIKRTARRLPDRQAVED